MKRNLIIILFLLLAAVAGFLYFTKDDSLFSKETSMYKAVPVKAPVFVELSALKSVPVNNPVIKNLMAMEKDILFLNKVAIIDSLIQNNKDFSNSLQNESLILAFDFVGEKDVFPLLIMKADKKVKQLSINKFLTNFYPAGKFSFSTINYSGRKITTISAKQKKSSLSYCFTDGLFLASPKSLLIERVILQLNNQSISDDVFFNKANKTASSQSTISWYINHRTFPDLAALWLNNHSFVKNNEFGEKLRSNYKNKFKDFRNFAAWTELDVEFNNNEIVFNGISTATDSLNHFLAVFDGQNPVRFQADKLLPQNTSFYTTFAFSDKELFFEKLENYFAHTDSYYKRENRIKKMDAGFRTGFKQTFQNLVKNEVIVATTSIPTETDKKTTLFIMQTESGINTGKTLNKILDKWAKRKKVDIATIKSEYRINTETAYTIYKFPYPSMPGVWLGKPFGLAETRFVTIYNDALVFSNTKKGLHNYLTFMNTGSTLAKDIKYAKLKHNIANKANINSYININRIFSLNKDVFRPEIAKKFDELKENLQKFKAVNWQVVCEKGISFNSVNLLFNNETEPEAETTWQTEIGSEIVTKPQLVINHRDKNNREIIFQDTENFIHLISNSGRENWKVKVDGPVLGTIHQIDYFRNGRLQFLFNTKNKLYLIDRLGRNVAHFPVKFKSPATNGVAVFDYDNNRKYRYFIAEENRKVIAYSYDGKVLTGWKFGKTESEVTTPVQHFRVNNKDYIVFKDNSHIYIQNRRGETRVKTQAKFENSKNPLILNLTGKPKIVATDRNGKVYYIYFNGKFEIKTKGRFSENHFFTVADINGNRVPDFIFVDGNTLKVTDENGKKLFTYKFKTPVNIKPNIYTFSSKVKKIGVTESQSNRIYLFNPSGKLHKGFPLQGNSEFSIGKLSKKPGQLNLIVGSRGGDLYNYTLN